MLNKQEAEQMARENILPFWRNMIDRDYGGFYGEAGFNGEIDKSAGKGCILNSRILWTFSAAYKLFKDDTYRECADHALDFLYKYFYDDVHGGVYWLADNKGQPLQTRKQFYNIAFAVYALSEYFLAFYDQSMPAASNALDLAMEFFGVLEKYGFDPKTGGYIEARARDWKEIDDFRLSEKDLNSPKSMNTNLHVLEAYTALSRACAVKTKTVSKTPDAAEPAGAETQLKKALKNLLRITLDKIVNRSHHFELFFDMDWNSVSGEVSYGHDIEGSWLMYEAALATGDNNLIDEARRTAISMADVILSQALDGKPDNGGFLSGCDEEGKIRTKREWWPQAEAVVGFFNAYELSKDQKYLNAAGGLWEYIKKYFRDDVHGEWHNELFADNTPDEKMPKAGFWKCPYHNARACFEIIKRIKQ